MQKNEYQFKEISRVLEPQNVLPTSAWSVDNSRKIRPDEIRISIKRIHLEGTSFKQIVNEGHYDENGIAQVVTDIVIRRGKLHNPVTSTGGLAYGIVDEIGNECPNKERFKVGDKVIINVSLSSLPTYIEKIESVDYGFDQFNVEGYAIVNDTKQLIPIADEEIVNLFMHALDESGTLYSLKTLVPGKEKFLVVGNNIITNLLYGYAIRKIVGVEAEVVCVLDKKSSVIVTGKGVDELTSKVFSSVHYLDILKPMECVEYLNGENYFDLSVNCAEIPGAETLNVLTAKEGGTVLFVNLINNLNIALYITETLAKTLDVRSASGFVRGYVEFDREIVEDIYTYFRDMEIRIVNKSTPMPFSDDPLNRVMMETAVQEDFICESFEMQKVLMEIMRVSKYDCNVIIFGDTGVGKEKVANIIQKNSSRKLQPFVKINCGAISPNLMESEFFGYERGAFTGANSTGKRGYFEIANNGVIFLDEIGELPLDMQAKLLRVIQDGEFYRVGGTNPVKSNVRILSATNRDLNKFVEEGGFRRDLFYRLNVIPINIPKLSDRTDDIPPLVKRFLEKYGKKFGVKKTISENAISLLQKQPWEGNVRELENTVQRLLISSSEDEITIFDVMREFGSEEETTQEKNLKVHIDENASEIDLTKTVEDYEKEIISYTLTKYGSTRKAAKALNISQTQLVRKKNKYGL